MLDDGRIFCVIPYKGGYAQHYYEVEPTLAEQNASDWVYYSQHKDTHIGFPERKATNNE